MCLNESASISGYLQRPCVPVQVVEQAEEVNHSKVKHQQVSLQVHGLLEGVPAWWMLSPVI